MTHQPFSVKHNNYYNNPKSNVVYTPHEVVKIILYIYDVLFKDFENNIKYFNILEPNCGDGAILSQLIEKFDGYFYTTEIDSESYKIVNDNVLQILNKKNIQYSLTMNDDFTYYQSLEKNIAIINDDFLTQKFNKKFHLIVCNPPFSMTKSDGKIIKGTWFDFLEKCFKLLDDNGKMFFILPNYWCTNTNKYLKNYSKYMTPTNFIILPKDIFYKGSIPCHIIIFNKDLNKKYDLDSNILKNVYKILYEN
jgi:type I restriction-modification system DNA methylase subunit